MTVTLQEIPREDLGIIADSGVPASLTAKIAENALPPAIVAQRALQQHEKGDVGWSCGTFYIVRSEDDIVVGSCGFKGAPVNGQVEVGYGVSPDCRNRGIATEALRELCRRAFATGEVQAVVAQVSPANTASCRVVEKLGFEKGEVTRDDDGEILVRWVSRPTPPPAGHADRPGGSAAAGR